MGPFGTVKSSDDDQVDEGFLKRNYSTKSEVRKERRIKETSWSCTLKSSDKGLKKKTDYLRMKCTH